MTYLVGTMEELYAALAKALKGDKIVLADGLWVDGWALGVPRVLGTIPADGKFHHVRMTGEDAWVDGVKVAS